jgi:hypothetical protein
VACFRGQWPSLKVSNFEQTIAVPVLIIAGGLRCPGLIQRHQALLGLVALYCPPCVHRKLYQLTGAAFALVLYGLHH